VAEEGSAEETAGRLEEEGDTAGRPSRAVATATAGDPRAAETGEETGGDLETATAEDATRATRTAEVTAMAEEEEEDATTATSVMTATPPAGTTGTTATAAAPTGARAAPSLPPGDATTTTAMTATAFARAMPALAAVAPTTATPATRARPGTTAGRRHRLRTRSTTFKTNLLKVTRAGYWLPSTYHYPDHLA
jgi:hypothetical protein